MSTTSFRAKAIIGAVVLMFVVVVNFIIGASHSMKITPETVGMQFLICCGYLGWLGLVELRRLGKTQMVREIQVIEFILVAPVLMGIVTSSANWLLMLAGAGMLAAFGLGMWHRRVAANEQLSR